MRRTTMPQLLLLCFAALLLVAVLISERANRTVLSTAVLFLLGGFVLGKGMLGVIDIRTGDPLVAGLAELALFSVLFTDGMRVGVADLRSAWRLPGRALLLGLPLTLVITAGAAHYVAGLPWLHSFLMGAILAPTDPVFAAAIVGREEVPRRLRHLLNVESGVNDGLALPVVLVLLAAAGGTSTSGWQLLEEIGLGVLVGLVVPMVVLRLERLSFLQATKGLQPLLAVSIGLLVLAAILVFGALITPSFLFQEIAVSGWVFAVLALLVARPLALLASFTGSDLPRRQQVAAMWFGPKGFASVVYGLLVLESGIGRSEEVFHLVALVIVLSILAHSSTDVLVARQFDGDPPSAASGRPAAGQVAGPE